MPHAKDPAIKLFGKTIISGAPPPRASRASSLSSSSSSSPPPDSTGCSVDDIDADRLSHSSTGRDHSKSVENQSDKDGVVPIGDDTPTILNSEAISCSSVMQDAKIPCDSPQEEMDQTENPHGKGLKKPDKILPCPRCKSMDTKFCYYNNYNVNQPRHFCKNCQRYWTAGGSMRNVPVGAGRRKNKVSASPFRVPDSSHSSLTHIPNAISQPSLLADNTVLKFGSNGCAESGTQESEICDQGGMHPWQSHSNSTQLSAPDLCRSGYPIQFYPAFWGCAVPPFWTFSWIPHPSSQLISTSSPISPTLGKHSRDSDEDEPGKEQNVAKVLWVPKTLRIDDPKEPARHCIWPSLGMKSEKTNFAGDGKLFGTYSKGEERNHRSDSSPWVSLRSPT